MVRNLKTDQRVYDLEDKCCPSSMDELMTGLEEDAGKRIYEDKSLEEFFEKNKIEASKAYGLAEEYCRSVAYYYNRHTKKVIKGFLILPHEPIYTRISDLLYIGDELMYENFVKERGITEFFTNGNGRIACVGVNRETKSWYGWSHRGYGKFNIGYVVVEGSMLSDVIAAGYSPQTEEHCKHLAHVFADLMD